MRSMDLDERHWPLLVTTFEGPQSEGDVEYYLRKVEAARARHPREAYVALAMINNFAPSLTLLKPLGDWMNANRAETKEWCKGSAIVLGSTALRFLLSSLYLIARPPCPMLVVETRAAADAWLVARLTEAGVQVPAFLR